MILQPSLVKTQDLGKEKVKYLYRLPCQIMHLLAFLFNLSIFGNVYALITITVKLYNNVPLVNVKC